MKRQTIGLPVGILAVLAFMAFYTQLSVRRTMEQERAYAETLEMTADGHKEYHTRVIALKTFPPAPRDRIDWFATAYADPSKPPFVVTFRRVLVPKETWEADAKYRAAFIVEGRRYALKPYQAVVDEGDESPVMVSFGGPRSILEAIAGAKSVEINFGGGVRDLGERGLANCRELLKRSEATAKR